MRLTVMDLCRAASRETGISERELLSRRRHRRLAWPRFAIMKVAHENGLSFPKIAQRLCMKDHTSVLHGCRRADDLEAANPAFALLIEALRHEFAKVIPDIHTDLTPSDSSTYQSTICPTEICGGGLASFRMEGA